MPEKYVFKGQIKDGKLYFDRRELFDLYISSLVGKVKITVKRDRKLRSTGKANETGNQNGLYWLYLQIIESETGNFIDDLHEYFKRKFLTPREIHYLSDKMTIPGSTAKLNTKEFSDYLEKIQVLTNIPIPNVDEI